MTNLDIMNAAIEKCELSLPDQYVSENIFIIGAPRSGTTLLSQLLVACSDVGYVNNLTARFWKAPSFGLELSDSLGIKPIFTGHSNYGSTKHISEPHEFGKFWRENLDYHDMEQLENHKVNWKHLIKQLNLMAYTSNSKMLYKVFQLIWHLSEFHSKMPNSKWIYITRDPINNAKSLLKFRTQLNNGDATKWVSAKPIKVKPFENSSPEIQVASQYIFINEWIKSELENIDDNSYLSINFNDLVEDTVKTIKKICLFSGLNIKQAKLKDIAQKVQYLTDPKISDNLGKKIAQAMKEINKHG